MRLESKAVAVPSREAVRASVGYDQLRAVGDALYWLESRPSSGGVTLVRWHQSVGSVDLTRPGFDVASGVHAYGGGAYAVADDQVWCITGDGLHLVDKGEAVVSAAALGDLVVGDGELLCVRESADGDAIVAVSLGQAKSEPRVLTQAPGFLSAPRPGPGLLAWSSWGEHDMPWDACELWVASYEPGGLISDPVKLAGGPDESVVEPRWGPEGALYFVSDRSGWWNLYRWDGRCIEPVAPMAGECAAEPWELGYTSYDFLGDGRIVMAVQQGPRHALVVVGSAGNVQEVPLRYTSIKPYLAARERSVALVGSSPTVAPQIAVVHLDGAEPRVQVLARAEHAELDGVAVSVPIELWVPVQDGREVLALVYPPTGAGSDWRAPVIVRAHPGPTASSLLRLDWQAQFFTSRGFAVVDVDYTGSTGYGRAFREALYGRWGVADVADCRAVAEHLLGEGHAIGGQVFVRGASAGGYTALQAVAQDGPFAAATAVSAIVDPDRWTATVPRFQRAHAARLRGGAGPVRAADIRQPVLMIHGSADDVATIDDVRELTAELAQRGAPHELLLLDGVGHYVASSTRAAAALEAELAHYRTAITAVVAG
ncbi:prolyl oligopeptidase family serine peptidase [Actinoplanes sp. NPDC049118]|uniref:S9 family peptidase n=1 Tax=Actinoplanes sp. NPDC049118 TaxID=3155769 RepID=UPI0033DC8AE9